MLKDMKIEIDIDCPNCGRKLKMDVNKPVKSHRCPGCGTVFKKSGAGSSKLKTSFADLDKSLDSLGKKLKR